MRPTTQPPRADEILARGCSSRPAYLLVWALAGLLAYALFGLGQALFAHQLAWHSGGRWLAAGVLILAALYQLTPPKHACLLRCRNAMESADIGSSDPASMPLARGARNGGWCLGASWAVMAALFALGVMSLTWMALVAVLVIVEKLSTRPRLATALTAGVLALLAVGVLAAPHAVPGLVVPAGHATPPSMRAMG